MAQPFHVISFEWRFILLVSNYSYAVVNAQMMYCGGLFTLQKESRHLEVKDSEPKEEQERPRKQYPLKNNFIKKKKNRTFLSREGFVASMITTIIL